MDLDLATLALTRINGGPLVPRRARIETCRYAPGRRVLRIVGTPGSWYLEDVRTFVDSKSSAPLAIDLGQRWTLCNAGDLLDEVDESLAAEVES